jgi:hypothetical protein
MSDLPPLTPELIERAERLPRQLRSKSWRLLWAREFKLALECYLAARICETLLEKIEALEARATLGGFVRKGGHNPWRLGFKRPPPPAPWRAE